MSRPKSVRIKTPGELNRSILRSLRLRVWVDTADGDSASLLATFNERGKARIPRGLPDAQIRLIEVVDSQGRVVATDNGPDWPDARITISLDASTVSDLERAPAVTALFIQRTGRLEFLGESTDFTPYQMSVAMVVEDDMRAVFGMVAGDTEPPQAWVEEVDDLGAALTRLALTPIDVGFDGRFSFRLPAWGKESGWAFLLSGPRNFLGYRADIVGDVRGQELVVLLPSGGSLPDSGEAGVPTPAAGDTSAPPLNATEKEILDHAGLFNDDPGPYCRPFSNPETHPWRAGISHGFARRDAGNRRVRRVDGRIPPRPTPG